MNEIKLDKVKRLELYNQYEILKHVDKHNHDDYEMKQSILVNGLEVEYPRLFEQMYDEIPSHVTDEVKDTFDMFRQLKRSYENLSDEDKKEIDLSDIKCDGYDGNHEHPHSTVAHFYLEQLKHPRRWEELGDYALNSHTRRCGRYAAMVAVWEKYKDNGFLTKEQMFAIIATPQQSSLIKNKRSVAVEE